MQRYTQLHTHILPLTEHNWLTMLRKPPSKRPLYKIEKETLHIGQVVVQFLGVPFANDDYYNQLHELIYGKEARLQLLTSDLLTDNEAFGHYVAPYVDDIHREIEMPKFLFYGEVEEGNDAVLQSIVQIGCDLIVFNPNGTDVLTEIGITHPAILTHTYVHNEKAKPFPKEKINRTATVAYEASREIEALLHSEGSGLYKQWQLRDHTPYSLTYKTTYDELFILAKEKAFVRPYFQVENGRVQIPALFAKVHGVSENRKEYWARLHALTLMKNSLLVRQFPFQPYVNKDFRPHYHNILHSDGDIVPERLIQSRMWKYGHLSIGLQRGIADAMKRMCQQPHFKPIHSETTEDAKLFLFTQAMQLPAIIIKLLQTFDYSQEIPKLIFYQNGLTGHIARSDAALLLFLNQFGIDIFIYNPAGHRDIERYIDCSVFDVHQLEDVAFEQHWREPSFLKRIFSRNAFY